MKQIYSILIMLVFAFVNAVAQPILKSEVHALKVNIDNPMSYCEYMQPGSAGTNVTWDFSVLKFQKSFNGFLKNATVSAYHNDFPESDTELKEFDSRFYFKVKPNSVEQYGYSSDNGKSQIRYDVPFVKMKFPFTFGDNFSGTFSGGSYFSGTKNADISGSYTVEADAYGTLILPGNTVYNNTLRVKTLKSYTTYHRNSSYETSIVTYRWYNSSHRYPLLVLTEYSVKSGNNTSVNYQAAYNNNAIDFEFPFAEESVRLFPVPSVSELSLEFNAIAAGNLEFTISDASGRILRNFSRHISEGGYQIIDLTGEIRGLDPASYFLIINSGDNLITKPFTLVE